MPERNNSSQPFRAALPAIMFVVAIFFCNFLSRMVFAPLMPVIQGQLGFTHAGAGNLFLMMAVGNATGLLLNGFVSRSYNHRNTVGISSLAVGFSCFAISFVTSYVGLAVTLFIMGVAIGLYLPSGIATVTSLVRKGDWGKTMAVHELAPNTAFVVAPLLSETVLLFFGWHVALWLLAGVQICLGIWFLASGRGGEFPGLVPGPLGVYQIVRQPVFWILSLCMCLAVGASIGPYTMLPLYLVDIHGYTREQANQLLSVSRIMACVGPFFAGWITDKWGARPAITLYLLLNGTALVFLGLTSGTALVVMVILQPIFSVLIFAPGFTMLSLVLPPEHRSIAVGLVGPINAIVGLGIAPAFLGHMGDVGLFHVGFLVQGVLLMALLFLMPRLPAGRAG